MKLNRLCIVLALLFLATGCKTPGYWSDRGHDACDVITLQLGSGYGAKGRIGPVQSGFLFDFGVLGLRGGECLYWQDYFPPNCNLPANLDLTCGVLGFEYFAPAAVTNRSKAFGSMQLGLLAFTPEKTEVNEASSKNHNSASYYTQIEAGGGAFISGRFGFNPGELLDFLFGWFGFGLYDDDLNRRETPVGLSP